MSTKAFSVSKRIKKVFQNTKADVIFLMNTNNQDSNFLYLTGFTSGVFEYTPLIVTRKKLILPVSILEYEIAKEQKPREMEVIKVDSGKQMIKIFKKYLGSKVVGINSSFMPYSSYKRLQKNAKPKKIINVNNAFYLARSIKDEEEIKKMRIANKIAKKALEETKKILKIGMTEKEVAAKLDYLMMEEGASGPSFNSIISFDINSALPHHMPDETKLKANSIVLMDIGARYNNYCSDITRTFVFKPELNSAKYKKFLEMHKTVKEAQELSRKIIKENVKGSEVHKAASDHIDNANNKIYKGKFIHSLGHAIGIEVHDLGPGLNPVSNEKLKANMIVSNEPGIYIVGFGGVRIEDDVLVTKKGSITF